MSASELLSQSRIKGTYKAITAEKENQNNLSPKAYFGAYNPVRGAYEVKTANGTYLPRQNRVEAMAGKGSLAKGFTLTKNSSMLISPKPSFYKSQIKPKEVEMKQRMHHIFSPAGLTDVVTSPYTPYHYELPPAPKGASPESGFARLVWSNLTNFLMRGKHVPTPQRPLELSFDFKSEPGPSGAHGIAVNFLPANFTGSGFTFIISDQRITIDPDTNERQPNPEWTIRRNDIRYESGRSISTGSSILANKSSDLSLPLSFTNNRISIKYDGRTIRTKHRDGELSADLSLADPGPLNFFRLFIGRPFYPSDSLSEEEKERFFINSKQFVSKISFGPFSAVGPDGQWRNKPFNLRYGIARGRNLF